MPLDRFLMQGLICSCLEPSKTKKLPTRSTAKNSFSIPRDATGYVQDVVEATHAIEAIMQSVSSSSSVRCFAGSAHGFRNLLAHDYGAIDDESVYGMVFSDLGDLKVEVSPPTPPAPTTRPAGWGWVPVAG